MAELCSREVLEREPWTQPHHVGLVSKPTTQADIESYWCQYWCERMGIDWRYHRKVWELAYVCQVLWEHGKLQPSSRGIGFACGQEPLASTFVVEGGVNLVVTDLSSTADESRAWQRTNQHSDNLEAVWKENLLPFEEFEASATFRSVDMRNIPEDLLQGQYDFVWSVCSFEHLGSLQAGVDFVNQAMKCLKPDGVAVHTTEYSFREAALDHHESALYDAEWLCRLMKQAGVSDWDFSTGSGPLDGYVDEPPYRDDAPHLKMRAWKYACTCFGLVLPKSKFGL